MPFDVQRIRTELLWKCDIWFGDKALGLKESGVDVIYYCQLPKELENRVSDFNNLHNAVFRVPCPETRPSFGLARWEDGSNAIDQRVTIFLLSTKPTKIGHFLKARDANLRGADLLRAMPVSKAKRNPPQHSWGRPIARLAFLAEACGRFARSVRLRVLSALAHEMTWSSMVLTVCS